ncbi:YdbH domain-containing protein [Azospirillum sp.]|uniref:YdbH domain-containing protein n=1 Tax=Azospirillum sp. TaxID=34012 RepID=UPI003D740AAE
MVAGAVALAVLASVAATLPGLLGTALTYAMRRGGLGDANAEVTDLGLTESRLSLHAAGIDARVAVRHPWGALLRGRAERITVSGVTVRLKDLPRGGGGGGVPALPADELVLTNSSVVLDAPGGPLTVAVEAVARPEGNALAFTGTATASGGVTMEAKGRHDPARGVGSADLRLRPVRLREGQPNLSTLVPRGAVAVAATAGRLSGRAKLAWDGKGLTSSGEVLMEDLAGSVGPVGVGGLSGVLRLTSLWPPVLPSGQTLAMKTLDVGLPLTDGVVALGLTRRGVLDIDRAEWRWAGGTVRAKPFEMALESPKGTIELEAEGLDLGTVLALASLEGLSAEGRLRGTLPVRIANGKVRLDGGVLEADAPGSLRYDPATPPAGLQGDPGSPTALLLGALTDFRYESLSATVDGEAGGEMRVGLRIRGANPEFYGGHPVALNLNLSGALDRILRQGLDAYRIPDAVRERMLDYQKKGPS